LYRKFHGRLENVKIVTGVQKHVISIAACTTALKDFRVRSQYNEMWEDNLHTAWRIIGVMVMLTVRALGESE